MKKMKSVLQNYKTIRSKRQPPNLKRLLTRAKFEECTSEATVKKCGKSKCGLCKHLIEGDIFNFRNGKTFIVKTSMSCDVQNVVYVMVCTGCNKEYIGETGDFLRKRMNVHRQQIRDPNTRMLYVSEHIEMCAASNNPVFKVFPLLKINSENTTLRKEKEKYLIRIFKPELNSRPSP